MILYVDVTSKKKAAAEREDVPCLHHAFMLPVQQQWPV